MKIKIPVSQLEQGMYVAELDRPWLGTPFLFQGFLIQDDEDLGQLRAVSEFVFVDDLQSIDSTRVQRKLREVAGRVQNLAPITVEFEEWHGLDRLRATLSRLEEKRDHAVDRLKALAKEVRAVSAESIRETRGAIVNLISDVSGDPKTGFWMTLLSEGGEELSSHAVNTSVLSVGFAAFLGMSDEVRNALGQGAMLHDIGMSKLPVWLREKRGALSARELNLIRHHARHGAKLLADAGLDERVLDVIAMHHERVDGAGYPRGLRGAEIPDHVKLFSVCNKYDVLTRGRDGVQGLAPAAALQQLMARADSQFDRRMVEAFIRWIGVYPLGSLVKLRNGYLCLVISTDAVRRLRPTVLCIRDSAGRALLPRRTINLEVLAHSPLAADWSIDGIVSPASAGIDVRQLLLEELRMPSRTTRSARQQIRVPA